MRLIDADDALVEIKNMMEVVKRDTNDDEYYLGLRRGALIIDQTRTIDAVPRTEYEELEQNYIDLHNHFVNWAPVVRCKDCKHYPFIPEGETYEDGFSIVSDEICPCICDDGWYSWIPPENHYCSYGERKE